LARIAAARQGAENSNRPTTRIPISPTCRATL
jgi:hypothetical protein